MLQLLFAVTAVVTPFQLDLARVCTGEAGFEQLDMGLKDCAAIHSVIMRRSHVSGLPPRRMLRRYSDYHFDRTRTDSRRWIPWLSADGARPRGMSSKAWSKRRGQWMRILDHSGKIIRGEVRWPCTEAPGDWGNREDLPRYYRQNPRARVVFCGLTANVFLRRR